MAIKATGRKLSEESKNKIRQFNIELRRRVPISSSVMEAAGRASKDYYLNYQLLKATNPHEFEKIKLIAHNAIKIAKIDLSGNIVTIFDSISHASRAAGFKSHRSLIRYLDTNQLMQNHFWKRIVP